MQNDLLTPPEAAEYLRLDERTLGNWRSAGRGPRYLKLGKIRYSRRDLDRWLEAHARDPEAPPRPRRAATTRRRFRPAAGAR